MTNARIITNIFALITLTFLPIFASAQPQIEFEWQGEWFDGDEGNWNNLYVDLFFGFQYELAGLVRNSGDEVLQVESSTDNEAFTVEPANFEVAAGQETQLTVTFDAPDPGHYEANLILHSNDPDNGELRIAMVADAVAPPNLPPIDDLYVEMNTGEVRREVITLENDGDSPLRFAIDIQVINEPQRDNPTNNGSPRRDDAGEQIGDFRWRGAGDDSYKMGIAYDPDNDYLLLTGYASQLCAVVDPNDDYAEVASWQVQGAPMGAAWLNGVFYVIEYRDGNEQIYRYDGEGNAIGVFADFLDGVIAIASSPEHNLILLTEADNADYIDAYDPDNAQRVGRLHPYPGWIEEYQIWSMTWVDKHVEGQLWLQFEGQWLYQLEIDLENFEVVNRNQIVRLENPADNNRNRWNGLGHDKENLIYGRYDQETYWILDDGIDEVYWISVEPTEGTIDPGASLDLIVTLDGSGMRSGEYVANVRISSNDPDNPNVEFLVTMNITGPDWEFEARWPESAGFPESINFEMAYEATFFGDSDTIVVEVSNVGFGELEIEEIACDNGAFRIAPDHAVIVEDEEVNFLVIFSPEDAGEFDGDVIIWTNDPDENEITVPIHGLAIAPPRMRVVGEDIDELPWQGEVIEHEIIIANDGGNPLRFEIDIENVEEPRRDKNSRSLRSVDGSSAPLRDEPGDLIGQFNGNNAVNQYCSPIGWDWDNQGMWVSNYNAQNAVRWGHDANYENFEEQVRIRFGNFMDGAWARGMLYLPTWASPVVNRYNDAGQNVGAIQMPFPVYGLAVDVENDWLFVLNPNDGMSIYVYELTDHGGLGDQIGRIPNHNQFHGNQVAYNLEWVPQHREGQLWITNAQTGRVHQIHVDTEEWRCTEEVQNFPVFPNGDQPYSAVAHDGHNLWAAGYFPGNIRIYDDGVEEANWLAVAPMAGVVAPDEEQVVTVTLDTHGLLGGEYSAELHIRSNDPENPEEVINVEMTGNDWDWGLWFDWPEENGFPDGMFFGETFVGETRRIIAEARNLGTDALVIDEILSDNEAFTVEPNRDIVLEPDEEIEIVFMFSPEETGDYEATFSLESNDPFYGDWEISTSGEGIPAPRMRIIGEDISERLAEGEVHVNEFIIANDGGNPLQYEIDIENVQEPQRDINPRSLRSVDGTSAPLRDEPGDLIGQFNGNNVVNQYCNPIGWDWDNEGMWVSNYNARNVVRWGHDAHYENFEEQSRFNWGPFMDGAWAKGLLYFPLWANPVVNRFNDAGQNVGAIQMPFPVYGMAVDVENDWFFFLNPNDGMSIYVYELTDDGGLGDQIGVIRNHAQFHGNAVAYNLEWVPQHREGQLWITNAQTGRVHQIAVDTEEWQCTEEVQSFAVFPQADRPYSAVAHDGHNLWAAGYFPGNIRIYDDGVQEANWLAVEPRAGVVAPEDEQVITVTLDTHGLVGGFYSAELHIRSNDPENPEEVINIEMTGNDWNQEDPRSLRWNPETGSRLEFPDTEIGAQSIYDVEVTNISDEVVELVNVGVFQGHREDFHTDAEEGDELEPEETREYHFYFHPSAQGRRWTELYIEPHNHNPEFGVSAWVLTGVGVVPPHIEVIPAELVNDLEFTVHNNGRSTLVVDSIYFEGESGAEFITPNSFEVEPDGEQTVTLDLVFPADEQYHEIYEVEIYSNDPEYPVLVVEAEYFDENGGGIHYPQGIEPTDSDHIILVTAVEFDGEPVRPNWDIGVFTPGGILSGEVVWTGGMAGINVYGADDDHEDYFHDGEVMTFRGYDRRSRQEHQLVASVEEGGLIWHDEGLTILSLHNRPFGRQFPLRQGWNLFSLNLIPSVEMREGAQWVEDLFSQLARANGGAHHVLLMKDQEGHFWRPANRFNNIPRWNPEQGYQICVDEEVYPEWFGIPIDPQADIPLRQGWNIAPYYPDYQLPANANFDFYVLSPILDYVLIAKDNNGNFMMPERGFSNMPPWREGQAYQIKVSEAVTLNYPAEQQMRSAEIGIEDENPTPDVLNQHFNPVSRTGSNMSVLLTLEPEHTDVPSAEIGAFTANGICVGSSSFQNPKSKIQIGLAVWGDDPSTEVIDGAVEGEGLTFRLWDGQTEEVLHFGEDRHSCLSYQTDEFASGVLSRTGVSNLPDQITLYSPSPNPFNSTTRISFALPEATSVTLLLCDINGRRIRVITEETLDTGLHSYSLDARNLSGGTYFVTLETPFGNSTRKVTLSK